MTELADILAVLSSTLQFLSGAFALLILIYQAQTRHWKDGVMA